jgi:hypothetical protein
MPYSAEEIQRRLDHWSRLPAESHDQIHIRNRAWCAYVDARDGRSEGHTLSAQVIQREGDAQIEMTLVRRRSS